jgi:hypothetical protein
MSTVGKTDVPLKEETLTFGQSELGTHVLATRCGSLVSGPERPKTSLVLSPSQGAAPVSLLS